MGGCGIVPRVAGYQFISLGTHSENHKKYRSSKILQDLLATAKLGVHVSTIKKNTLGKNGLQGRVH